MDLANNHRQVLQITNAESMFCSLYSRLESASVQFEVKCTSVKTDGSARSHIAQMQILAISQLASWVES
jgi:hypothetical protein